MSNDNLTKLQMRDLLISHEEEIADAYQKLIRKYGAPRNEEEREKLYEQAERNVERRYKSIKQGVAILTGVDEE